MKTVKMTIIALTLLLFTSPMCSAMDQATELIGSRDGLRPCAIENSYYCSLVRFVQSNPHIRDICDSVENSMQFVRDKPEKSVVIAVGVGAGAVLGVIVIYHCCRLGYKGVCYTTNFVQRNLFSNKKTTIQKK